ncbi:hypothetical protein [Halocatena marina]|uniref:Uncharacterized protein n=1 Tax=Halocatena marina TaxID=2934937 RepID=A0ABD5YSJ7_9EURY|nr:hypothetical protein [Halocatena marina]
MKPDGTYEQVRPADDDIVRDTQSILMEQTQRARTDGESSGAVVDDQPIDADVEPNAKSERSD